MQRHSVEAILRALEAEQVRYLIAGRFAVVAHGYVHTFQNCVAKTTMNLNERTRRDAAFERHRLEQLRRMAQLTLLQKVEWLEEAQQLALQLQAARDQSTLKEDESQK